MKVFTCFFGAQRKFKEIYEELIMYSEFAYGCKNGIVYFSKE